MNDINESSTAKNGSGIELISKGPDFTLSSAAAAGGEFNSNAFLLNNSMQSVQFSDGLIPTQVLT
ncbi:hypothetical protein [Acinetobacter sp.]|jgi:hypothetical protein|uniref:hypothetical protein n=1 Tax=Acinetobacter sp. TaxID=472 RepID=UPI0035B14EDF